MTDEEQLAAIKYTVDVVNHRVPVIAGAGSNDTDHGCALAAKSAECGADALLMVTPITTRPLRLVWWLTSPPWLRLAASR